MSSIRKSHPHWEVVERVGASSLFQKSSRLREFFFYICERSLEGRKDELREQRIGQDVFSRGADFRPNEDNIVRVEARELRRRLEEYFANEGRDEPLVITIPKGAYVAAFEAREKTENKAPVPAPPPSAPAVTPEATQPPAGPASPAHHPLPWLAILAATSVCLLVVTVLLAVHVAREPSGPGGSAPRDAAQSPLWASIFNADHQTYIVCADSALVLGEEITEHIVSLSDYVNRSYWPASQRPPNGLDRVLKVLPQRQYTGISDVRLVQLVMQINHGYRDRTTVRSARNVQLVDFKSGNFVLFGSRLSTPWVEVFEPLLNFRFNYDFAAKRSGFSNTTPQPGEKSVYWIEGDPLQPKVTYGMIALVPNLSNNGNVLMIAGATGEGTEAAGEYVTNPVHLRHLLDSIHAIENGHVRHFEVLLRSGAIAGTPENAEVVAYRLLNTKK